MKSFHKLTSILLAFILFAPSLAWAETYYVDFDAGSDTNTGMSQGQAWRSIPGATSPLNWSNNIVASWGNGSTLPGGAISTANRIPVPSTIFLKRGTTASTNDGIGQTFIRGTSSGFYTQTGNSNSITGFGGQGLTIKPDPTWGTGPVIIDMAGTVPGIASWVIQLHGVTVTGNETNGLVFRNNPLEGLQFKEDSDGSTYPLKYVEMSYITATNNGLTLQTDTDGSGKGQINVRFAKGLRASKLTMVGPNTNFINGLIIGDSAKTIDDGLVWDSVASNLRGDTVTDDSGIGFKAFNTQATYTNVYAFNCLKGMDLGEQNSPSTFNSKYTVLNSTLSSNVLFGMGLTGSASLTRTNTSYFKIFNNLVFSNGAYGIKLYSAPHHAAIVHNVFGYNGATNFIAADRGHIRGGFDNSSETNGSDIFVLNNIMYRPYDSMMSSKVANQGSDNLTFYSDWNVYARSTTDNYFFQWSAEGGNTASVGYGSPWTPGNTSGQWFTWEGATTSADQLGTWHAGSDANSTFIANGAGENSDVNMWTVGYPTYSAGTIRAGTNISALAWYVPGMGYDRYGNARTNALDGWKIGAYQATVPAPPPPPSNPSILTDCCGLPLGIQ